MGGRILVFLCSRVIQLQTFLLCSLLTEIINSHFVFLDVADKKVTMKDQWMLVGQACVATYVKTRGLAYEDTYKQIYVYFDIFCWACNIIIYFHTVIFMIICINLSDDLTVLPQVGDETLDMYGLVRPPYVDKYTYNLYMYTYTYVSIFLVVIVCQLNYNILTHVMHV